MLYFSCQSDHLIFIPTSHDSTITGDSRVAYTKRTLPSMRQPGFFLPRRFQEAAKMRDLVYKNLTSGDRKRRVISSSEIINQEGVRSVIRRHFVYMVREVSSLPEANPAPLIYVLKERNHKEQKEKFFCKVKGDIYAINNGKFFCVTFLHSLNIVLAAQEDKLLENNQK